MSDKGVEKPPEKDISFSVAQPSLSRDEEYGTPEGETSHAAHLGRGELEVIHIRESNALLRTLQAAEAWMDEKVGIETIGAERVPEDRRRPPRIANVSFNFPPPPFQPSMKLRKVFSSV